MSIVTDAWSATLYGYIVAPSIVVFYLDYILTLPQEIQYVWSGGLSRASALFYLNRYPALLFEVAVIVMTFSSAGGSELACQSFNLATQIDLVFTQVVVASILYLRTCALYHNSKAIIIFLLTSGSILLAVSVWAMTLRTGYTIRHVPTIQGCMVEISPETALHVVVPWEALALADIIIFSLTVYQTVRARKMEGRESLFGGGCLPDLIFRDGAIYFLTMILVNVANILTFLLSPPLLKSSLTSLSSRISVAMMSRLMLNIYASAQDMIMTDPGILNTTIILGTHIEASSMVTEEDMDWSHLHSHPGSPSESGDDMDGHILEYCPSLAGQTAEYVNMTALA